MEARRSFAVYFVQVNNYFCFMFTFLKNELKFFPFPTSVSHYLKIYLSAYFLIGHFQL